MRYIKICIFLILLNAGKMAYSMPAPWGDKEKTEEYVRDRQGNMKEQGQGSDSNSNANSSTNGSTNGSRSRH